MQDSAVTLIAEAHPLCASEILRRTHAVIYLYDPHGGHSLFQNRPLAELAGYPPSSVAAIDNEWRNLMHPDDIARFAAHRRRLKMLREDETAEFEFRLRDPAGGWRWMMSIDAPFAFDATGQATLIVGHATDITPQKRAESRLSLLLHEYGHRMRNLHTMIQSIVSLTFRSKPADFLAAVSGRLRALADANEVLSGDNWRHLGLNHTVGLALAPHGAEGRVDFSGTDIVLGGAAAGSLTLVFNELTTNAVKYGALASDDGRIEIRAEHTASGARIEWRERGGPPVSSPGRTSFGTKLIRRSVEGLQGKAEFEWPAEGLICRLSLPASALAEPMEE